MSIKCLVLDHDDTVVRSTSTVHWPCFVEYMARYHSEKPPMSLEKFFLFNFKPGVLSLLRDICGMDDKELAFENQFWNNYVAHHIPDLYPGIGDVIRRFTASGGAIAVISHSLSHNILRDYRHHALPRPLFVSGWDDPPVERKPSPVPLLRAMARAGATPEETLVVDDLPSGLEMARAAGVRFAAARWDNRIKEIDDYMRENADLFFRSPEDLMRFLFPAQTDPAGKQG